MRRFAFLICCFLALNINDHAATSLRAAPEKVDFSPEQIAASKKIKYVIVLFQENWSFDSLYGKFPGVNGLDNASEESKRQVNPQGLPYPILPLCIDTRNKKPYPQIPKKMANAPFDLEPYIPLDQITGDLVHRFYQEIFQINRGRMDAFAAFSDAHGFVMSYYDISPTRMGKISREYTICDHFFHSCYGGSTCGALWLFSAQMPVWPDPSPKIIAKLNAEGKLIKDGLVSPEGYAINDAQPFYAPYKPSTPVSKRMPPQDYPTIGDRLSEKGVSWGWFAEGWDDALNGKAPPTFPYHHQAPSYFKQFAPGTEQREKHLFDLNHFYTLLKKGVIPSVSFIRSLDKNSQHPGDGTLLKGLNWCADFIEQVQSSPIWPECAIILTYDENGGRWDHVAPPIIDNFGPATRVPAVIISPYAKRGFVDHTCYETVSILKFIEQLWELSPLTGRDAQANNLLNSFDF